MTTLLKKGFLYFAVEKGCECHLDDNDLIYDECDANTNDALKQAYGVRHAFHNPRGIGMYSLECDTLEKLKAAWEDLEVFDGVTYLEKSACACQEIGYAFEFEYRGDRNRLISLDADEIEKLIGLK